MKKIYLSFFGICAAISSFATNAQLIVQKVNNQGIVPGQTYRVYAQLSNPNASLHMVWGDEAHPLNIQSTAPFYQNELAGYSSAFVNENNVAYSPGLKYDSWITVGYENGNGNGLWDIGVDFSGFNSGGSIHTNNGGWFLIPTDARCNTNNGLVLIAQFTTTGVVTGTLNLQGLDAPQQAWKEFGLSFSTSDAKVFGCTDPGAANYNADASFNDGSCEGNSIAAGIDQLTGTSSDWSIFPNPIRENLINVQFGDAKQAINEGARFDIFDGSGKLVASHYVGQSTVNVAGNKVTLQQNLVAGTYKVVYIHGNTADSKTLVVTK